MTDVNLAINPQNTSNYDVVFEHIFDVPKIF